MPDISAVQDKNLLKAEAPQFAAYHSSTLATTSNIVTYPTAAPLSFKPNYWLIVARLTTGYILISPGSGPISNTVKLDYGVVELPSQSDRITIEAVGATGFYSVYAVADKTRGFIIYE